MSVCSESEQILASNLETTMPADSLDGLAPCLMARFGGGGGGGDVCGRAGDGTEKPEQGGGGGGDVRGRASDGTEKPEQGGGGGGDVHGRAGDGTETEKPEPTVESSAMMPDDSMNGAVSHCVGRFDGTEEPEQTVESSATMPDDSMNGAASHCVGRFGIVIGIVIGMASRLDLCRASSSGVTRAHSRSSTWENLAATTESRF